MEVDEPALRSLSAEYARALDRRDEEGLAEVFSEDAVVRVFNPTGSPKPELVLEGRDALTGLTKTIENFSTTFHFVGNATYETAGDRATGEVYCIANHFRGSGPEATNFVMLIRYRDLYKRISGSWKIAQRDVLVDGTEYRRTDGRSR